MNDHGALGYRHWQGKQGVLREKTVSRPHCLPQIPHRQAGPCNSMWPYVSDLSPNIFYFLYAVPHKIYQIIWMTADKIKHYLLLLSSTINIRCFYIHTSPYMRSSLLFPLIFISATQQWHYQYVHQVIKKYFKTVLIKTAWSIQSIWISSTIKYSW